MKTDGMLMNTCFSWSVADRSYLQRFYGLPGQVSLFLALSVLLFSCSLRDQKKDQHTSNGQLSYASLDPTVKYVGMETCRGCHVEKYDSYLRTGMGKSFGPPTTKKSSAQFPRNGAVHDTYADYWYFPYTLHDSLYLREYRLEGRDTVYQRNEAVSFIVGSGQHTNSHLQQVNGYLHQLPLTYYTQSHTWDLPPGFEKGQNSRFSRKIEPECISCHNGYPEWIPGSENKYGSIPLGIDCERCHGPGERHVRLKQAGEFIDTAVAIDYSIVNPAKLPMDYQLDICQRCHIQGNAVLADGKSFFDFKPGMRLSEVMDIYMPVYEGQEEEHIMASHAERMKMSPCFLVSKQRSDKFADAASQLRPYRSAMTCVTCHNPHVSVQETGKQVYNAACKNCHQAGGKSTLIDCSAAASKRKSAGDDCVSCHMPKNGTIDIPHVRTTDHYIRKPVTAEYRQKVKRFVTLSCINNSRSSAVSKGVAFLNYYEKFVRDPVYLDSAKHYLSDVSPGDITRNFAPLIRWAYLKEDYSTVLRYVRSTSGSVRFRRQEGAWTSYRIAMAYENTGDPRQAEAYLDTAVRLLPYQLDFRVKYASVLEDRGEVAQATEQYKFILQEDPRHVTALVNYGYMIAARAGNIRMADSLYDRALSLDPDYIQALLNKTGTCVLQGQTQKAWGFLNRVLILDPDNAKALVMKQALSSKAP